MTDDLRTFSAADLARWARVSRQAVNKAGRQGPLAAARVGRGRFDIAHPAAREWLEAHGVDPENIEPLASSASPEELERRLGPSRDDDLDEIASLTLAEVTDRYGGHEAFFGWVRCRKELATARRQEALLSKLEGQLVSRDHVQTLFQYLDRLSIMLLRDESSSIGRLLAPGGRTPEDATAMVRDRIGAQIEAARDHMQRAALGYDTGAVLKDAIAGPRPDPRSIGADRERARLRSLLRASAAPRIVDLLSRQLQLDPRPSASELAGTVATIIEGAIDRPLPRSNEEPPCEDTPSQTPTST